MTTEQSWYESDGWVAAKNMPSGELAAQNVALHARLAEAEGHIRNLLEDVEVDCSEGCGCRYEAARAFLEGAQEVSQ